MSRKYPPDDPAQSERFRALAREVSEGGFAPEEAEGRAATTLDQLLSTPPHPRAPKRAAGGRATAVKGKE